MTQYIYYDGIGAKKSGKHTVKEFLKIMNTKFNIECSEFLPDLEYEPCSKLKEMNDKALEFNTKNSEKNYYNIINNKPPLVYKRSKKNETRYKSYKEKCTKYRKTAKKRKCNLEEYIKFSGATNEN